MVVFSVKILCFSKFWSENFYLINITTFDFVDDPNLRISDLHNSVSWGFLFVINTNIHQKLYSPSYSGTKTLVIIS